MTRGGSAPAEAEQVDFDATNLEAGIRGSESTQLFHDQGRHLFDPRHHSGLPLTGTLAVEGVGQAAAGAYAFDVNRYISLFGTGWQPFLDLIRIEIMEPRDIADIVAVAVVRRVAFAVITVGGAVLADVFTDLGRHAEVDRIAARHRFAIGLVVTGTVEEQAQSQYDARLFQLLLFFLLFQQVVRGRFGSGLHRSSSEWHGCNDRGSAAHCRGGASIRAVGSAWQGVDQPSPAWAGAVAVQGSRRTAFCYEVINASGN
ncbi:hypothetical protein D9M70_380520 [compost metagenome]